jgi:hypothetical protein
MHHQIQTFTKSILQFCLYEHEGWEHSLIFQKSHNLNHSQLYYFYELKKSSK